MNSASKNEWQNKEQSEAFLDQADHLIQDRPRLFSLFKGFYKQFFGEHKGNHVLDLGSGDGIAGETLKSVDESIRLSAWDGSETMLSSARERLDCWKNVEYHHMPFSEIITRTDNMPEFDFVVSSLAIHHASHDEKRELFGRIHQMLKVGGYFIQMDVALPDHRIYEPWYNEIWREWLLVRKEVFGLDESILDTPEKARSKPENKYESLSEQLRLMKNAGFMNVECHYKAGLFAMYGGRK